MNHVDIDILERYAAAVLAKDVGAFIALYSPDVRVFDAWGCWSYEGAAAWREAARQWFASLANESVAVSAQEVRVTGGQDAALLSAIVTYASISPAGERLRAMQNRLSWGLARHGDSWRIVHEHTSAPIGFDDMKGILTRSA
jgi:uncharacterized protein (TIGR02246 family)